MMKKNEVLEILENGGYIYLNEIYNHARVCDAAGVELDSCRYDTAQKIGAMEGYQNERIGSAWNYTRFVSKIGRREEVKAAAAAELYEIRTPGRIEIRAKASVYIGRWINKGTSFGITVYGDGTHSQPANAYGTLYDFDAEKHAVYFEIIEKPEPAQEAAQNEEENEMNKTNLTNREIRAAREALVNAHSANRENGPAATVAALVESLGYDRTREIVALMTAARGTWDTRISSVSRAWAASVTSTTESELTDRCIYYCDEIHPAHFEQIAQAMQQYQHTQDEPEQDEQQPDEIAVDDLLEDLDTGDYGEYLNDYRDSSEYISDAISEIADNHTSIYYSDIMVFIRNDPDALADVIDQGLYDPTHDYDLHQHGQAAQYMRIMEDIYNHQETALYMVALHFVKYDLKRDTIPGDLADLIETWAADPGERMDEIPDRIREYFADQDAEQ